MIGASARCLVIALIAGGVAATPGNALEQKLTATDAEAGDRYGYSVAIDGDTIVVGAPGKNGIRGAVYVFRRGADGWFNTAKLTASAPSYSDNLGMSVDVDGDTIVAGAPGKGSVYTFSRDCSGSCNETAELTASSDTGHDLFGISVAIDGDRIVASASNADDAYVDQGVVYTFETDGLPSRTETAILTASDGQAEDSLGDSVAIDGPTIVAGSHSDVGGFQNRGAVYTFARTGPANREETAKLTASDGTEFDSLGHSVSIDGDTILAGAIEDDIGGGIDQGSAYTFHSTGAPTRTETAKLTASDGGTGDNLGDDVAIEGDSIVAGASPDTDRGAAYAFARTGPSRVETGRLTAADRFTSDFFGHSVAVDSGTIVAGAFLDDTPPVVNHGSAYVFFEPSPARDTTSPDTKLKGPKRVEQGRKARFRFKASEAGSSFLCKLDRKGFKPCASPRRVRTGKLATNRRHKFKVKAVDPAGNVDSTPAKLGFRVREDR